MNKLIIFLGILFLTGINSFSQADNSVAVHLAHKMAKKMKDSLSLSAQQRQDLFQVNMNLHNSMQAIRLENPPADSLQKRIQRVEKTRDSLYQPVLGPEKYQLYLQKKRNLLNNN